MSQRDDRDDLASTQAGLPESLSAETLSAETLSAEPGPPEIDEAQIERAIFELRSQQNLLAALVAGILASIIAGALWAGITVASGFQIGWLAVGIGFLVGFAVRNVGKGLDPVFGYLGGALSLLGCLGGNLAAIVGIVAQNQGVPFLDLVTRLDVATMWQLMVASFSPIDLLFYGIAVYEGYRLSFRQMTDEDAEVLLEP